MPDSSDRYSDALAFIIGNIVWITNKGGRGTLAISHFTHGCAFKAVMRGIFLVWNCGKKKPRIARSLWEIAPFLPCKFLLDLLLFPGEASPGGSLSYGLTSIVHICSEAGLGFSRVFAQKNATEHLPASLLRKTLPFYTGN